MRDVIDVEVGNLCELVSRLLAMREMGKSEVPLGPHAESRLSAAVAAVRTELAQRATQLAPVPGDLRLSNGMPCISVDHEEHSIGIILPEGFRLTVITPHSGQELLTEPRVLRDKTYATGHVLSTVSREPPPRIVGR